VCPFILSPLIFIIFAAAVHPDALKAALQGLIDSETFLSFPELQKSLLQIGIHSAIVDRVYNWKAFLAQSLKEGEVHQSLEGMRIPLAFRANAGHEGQRVELFYRGYSAGLPLADYLATSEDQGWLLVEPPAALFKDELPELQPLAAQAQYTTKKYMDLQATAFMKRWMTHDTSGRAAEAAAWFLNRAAPRPPQAVPAPFSLPPGVTPAAQRLQMAALPRATGGTIVELPHPEYIHQLAAPPLKRKFVKTRSSKSHENSCDSGDSSDGDSSDSDNDSSSSAEAEEEEDAVSSNSDV